MISSKKDILKQMLDNLNKRMVLSGSSVHSLSNTYDMYVSEVSPYLNLTYKRDLHIIYEKLKNQDKYLDEFETVFKEDVRLLGIEKTIMKYQDRLVNYKENYDIIINLIKKYVK